MSKENECYAYFTVAGDFEPDVITQAVHITPTECWRKGDYNPCSDRERSHSRWSLRSRLATTEELESHVADVLDQLDANPLGIKELSIAEDGVMQLVAYFHSLGSGLNFPRGLIKRMAEYELSVDCDFYYLYSDKRDDSST